MTAPPSYKKVNPADSPILLLSLRVGHDAAHHGRRIRRHLSWPSRFRRSPASRRSRSSATTPVDPHPGRPGQARRQRHHAGGHPRALVNATTNAAKGTLNTATTSFTMRPTTRSSRPSRSTTSSWPTATARRSGCATSARRSADQLDRNVAAYQNNKRRHHPGRVQAAGRQRRRHGRPDQGAAAAAHRPHPAGHRGRHPRSTAPPPSAPRSPTSSSRWG